MAFLDSLFSGAKAFVNQLVTVIGQAVRLVLDEIDKSPFGKAATELFKSAKKKYFSEAADLAQEERELAEKASRDGKRSEQDEVRLREIEAERDRLRKEMDAARSREAAEEFKAERDDVLAAPMTDDELSAAVGILSSKTCPKCGGTMRIRQGNFKVTYGDVAAGKRDFWWQCTASNRLPCPTIPLSRNELGPSVLRKENPDLDGDAQERKQIWDKEADKIHSRLRQHLDEKDDEMICPRHLLPMKLVQKRDGLLLSSYEYICIGIQPDGRACPYTVELRTFPQVAAMLRRHEGRGIIDA